METDPLRGHEDRVCDGTEHGISPALRKCWRCLRHELCLPFAHVNSALKCHSSWCRLCPPPSTLCWAPCLPWPPGPGLPTFTANVGTRVSLFPSQGADTPRPPCHAEECLLQLMSAWELDPKRHYRVTWYISWSPCEDCAHKLAAFLAESSHVSLRVFASRIYTRGCYEPGLCALQAAGAQLAIMTSTGQHGSRGGGRRAGGGPRPEGLGRMTQPSAEACLLPAEAVLDPGEDGGVRWKRAFRGERWSWAGWGEDAHARRGFQKGRWAASDPTSNKESQGGRRRQ